MRCRIAGGRSARSPKRYDSRPEGTDRAAASGCRDDPADVEGGRSRPHLRDRAGRDAGEDGCGRDCRCGAQGARCTASRTARSRPGDVDIPVRVYWPNTDDGLPVLVWLHGGGWVLGSIDTHDNLCRLLCSEVGAIVVSVDYRLAPETKFPGAVDDCDHGVAVGYGECKRSCTATRTRIAIGGDSAGGNLAAVTCLVARETQAPAAAASSCSCIRSPTTSSTVPSMVDNAVGLRPRSRPHALVLSSTTRGLPPTTTTGGCRRCVATSHGLPPALVITAEYDPLRDQGEAYADEARRRRRRDRAASDATVCSTASSACTPSWNPRRNRGTGRSSCSVRHVRRPELIETCRSTRKPRCSATRSTRSAASPASDETLQQARDGLALLHASGGGEPEAVYAIGDLDAGRRPRSRVPAVARRQPAGRRLLPRRRLDHRQRRRLRPGHARARERGARDRRLRRVPARARAPVSRTARRLLDRARVGHARTRRCSRATRAASRSPATARAATSPQSSR